MLMEVYIFIDVSLLISSSSFNSIIQSTTKQPIQQQAIYTSLPSNNITISHIYTQPITTHHQKSLCLPLPQLNNHVLTVPTLPHPLPPAAPTMDGSFSTVTAPLQSLHPAKQPMHSTLTFSSLQSPVVHQL
ncbi:hypothetical protein H4I95_00144 [Botrytis cinerea]